MIKPHDSSEYWIRNRSDELAVKNGCLFDELRGAETVWWIERHCRLYEGELAGEPLYLWGCHECGNYNLAPSHTFSLWDDAAKLNGTQRAAHFTNCVQAGHEIDWQYECVMRGFSWVTPSEKWKRYVRRFKQLLIFIAKKNKKSPTAAALGLYMTCGDGEPGAKTYFGAKDGMQSRKIIGDHAKQMVIRSPDLAPPEGSCRLNETLMRITHVPTTSYMEPMSSSNSRTQESKEGLNGNIILDELHVVDRDLARRVSRAGISRSEPLHIEISTAGNKGDGYGKERFDYGLEVQAGKIEDEQLFVAIYAAPQDVSDEAILEDPLKYGKMANPAMGQTVDPREFLHDVETSHKKGIQEWLDCLMYRFNRWQKGSNPWLPSGDWDACEEDYTEEDLYGLECWAALDLSRIKDMTSLVLMFKDAEREEHFRQLVWFWLPEKRAEEMSHEGVKLEWPRDGHLTLTPGNVIDFGFIKAQIRKLAPLFQIQELTFDPKFAEEVTQSLCDGEYDDKGNCIVPGLGIERHAFAQNDENFAQPTQDYERLILAHKLHHNGNQVLTWQAGHAQVMRKINKVIRVVKPKANSPKTVDGMVAGVMALGRCMQAPDTSWFKPGMMRD